MVASSDPSSRCALRGRERRCVRDLGSRIGLGLVALAIVAVSLRAEGAEPLAAPIADPAPGITAPATRPLRPAHGRPGAPPLDQRWRARGVAFVDLPFGLRARYDAQTLHRPTPGNELETAFSDRSAAFDRSAGAVGRARLLESRLSLSHALAHHVEIELSWAARSPLSRVDLLRIEDQRVAAMIRFVP